MIMNKTTELGLQCVLYMAQQPAGHLVNPQEVAEQLGESGTYMAKVLRQLATSGIIRSHRGVSGGFELVRPPREITLLSVVEACQGPIQGNYCQEVPAERVWMAPGDVGVEGELPRGALEMDDCAHPGAPCCPRAVTRLPVSPRPCKIRSGST
jgi:Rrf2 family protein